MKNPVEFGWDWDPNNLLLGIVLERWPKWWAIGFGVGPLHVWLEKA